MGRQIFIGHTHFASDVGGPPGTWRVIDCGACVKGKPFSFGWIAQNGTAGVEIERSA
jgi:hypothetical protein